MAFFNPFRPSYLADPYASLARLREEEPVFFSRDVDAWVLTRHADCSAVLRDHERFSTDPARARGALGEHVRASRAASPMEGAPLIGSTDAPVHTRLRAIVNRAFTPRVVEGEREFARETAEALLSRRNGPFEFMAGLAEPLPVAVIGHLLGLTSEERDPVRGWAVVLMRAHSGDPTPAVRDGAAEAKREMLAFLARYVETHRDSGGGRLIAILLEAEREGERLLHEELLAFATFLYTAGTGPTALALNLAVTHLAQFPDAAEAVRADRALLRPFLEESLRFDSATHSLLRYALADVEVGGRTVRAGDTVHVMVGAAHRDPEVFPEPDRFELHRRIPAGDLLSFGAGPHFCLGMPLAYLEEEEAIGALLDRFPRIEVVEQRPLEGSLLMRGPNRLVLAGA